MQHYFLFNNVVCLLVRKYTLGSSNVFQTCLLETTPDEYMHVVKKESELEEVENHSEANAIYKGTNNTFHNA